MTVVGPSTLPWPTGFGATGSRHLRNVSAYNACCVAGARAGDARTAGCRGRRIWPSWRRSASASRQVGIVIRKPKRWVSQAPAMAASCRQTPLRPGRRSSGEPGAALDPTVAVQTPQRGRSGVGGGKIIGLPLAQRCFGCRSSSRSRPRDPRVSARPQPRRSRTARAPTRTRCCRSPTMRCTSPRGGTS